MWHHRGRVDVSSGFLLLAALLYYLDEEGILLWTAVACLLHEGGHLAAIYALGGRVVRLRLTLAGAEMVLSSVYAMGPGGECLAALAGPVSNLAAAALATRMGEGWFLFAGLNLGLAALNLLPLAQLDGGRAIYHLLVLLWSPGGAGRVVELLSRVTLALLLLAGLAVLWVTGANFTLLVTTLWLAFSRRNGEGRTGQPRMKKRCRRH